MLNSAHRWKSRRSTAPHGLVNRLAEIGDEAPSPDGIRWELVNRVRAEIAAGTYDTEEKWALAEGRVVPTDGTTLTYT